MTSFETAKEKAQEIDTHLLATDERFRMAIMFRHEDGSTLYFKNAFAMEYDGWYLIFTEHHGTHVYGTDDGQLEQFKAERIGNG